MTIFLYCAVMIGLGYGLRRWARDGGGFFLAGRSLKAPLLGLSLAATAFGGSALLVATQLIYARGLSGLWFSGSVALGFAVLGACFAARIRATGAHSLADYVGLRHGEAARRWVSALIVVIEMAFFGLTVKSFALLTTPLMAADGWAASSPALYQALICAVLLAYTLLGGQRAVAATDAVQFGLIVLGLVGVLLPLGLQQADLASLPLGFLSLPFSGGLGPSFAVNMFCLMGLSGVVGGDVFSKILSARDEEEARRGAWWAAGGFGLLAATVALLALCARALLPGLAAKDQPIAILLLARQLLPGPAFQLITLALLSALLSTASSVILTGSTVLTLDVLRLGERRSSAAGRLLTALLAAGGLGLALYFSRLLDIMTFGYTLLTAGVIVPVLFTLALESRPRPRTGWFMAAMAAGLAGALAWKAVAGGFASPLAALDPATVGVALSSVVMLASLRCRRIQR